jgi:ribosomal protein L24E
MKKIILFIAIILIFIIAVLYSPYFKEFYETLDEKKVYKVENIKSTEINTLEEFEFFDKGIISYNSQKIIYTDFNNNILWENQNTEFSNKVFVTDNNIFRQINNNIIMLDKNNQEYLITEIDGNIINVSRENGKTGMLVKGNGQTLYIINENNEVVVDNKKFNDTIIGISINDKSEAYSIVTLNFENEDPVNTLYYLIDGVELWNSLISNEILIKTKVVNNNVIVIGTKNIYFYNNNGKLMWKNSIYNKILDYEISRNKINILFEKGELAELITYNFEGKVMEIQAAPSESKRLKIVDNKAFVYNDNAIYLLHNNKIDKIFDGTERFEEILIEGNNIYILFKNKIITGQIK